MFLEDDIMGDTSEIEGQWRSRSGRYALQYLVGHVRCHVAVGTAYQKVCGICFPVPRGSEPQYYRQAKGETRRELLEILLHRITNSEPDLTLLVRLLSRRPTSVI